MSTLTHSPAWNALHDHRTILSGHHLRDLFEQDEDRFDKFSLLFNDILIDYSKQPINSESMTLLMTLARQQGLEEWIGKMFRGERVNNTENRAALHVALRGEGPFHLDGVDITPSVKRVLMQMDSYTQAIRSGELKGYSGSRFTDVVNIGIGGSDLGPSMVIDALKPYTSSHIVTHFVSNIDGTNLIETLKSLNPETTLFIISSKTFTTQETMTNARSAREWFIAHGGREKDIAKHFIAVSSNREEVEKFGIDPSNMFEFWDWVGGRYSLWSAIGLPIAIAIGMENFYQLLDGASRMDHHFKSTPLEKNLPVILALIGIWQINFCGATTHAVLPYDQSLHRLPAYLQQIEMESNGKTADRDGRSVDYSTGVVLWGEPGTNGQHAFYQLLHQGNQIISSDFLAPCQSQNPIGNHHTLLMANFFAQTESLMKGRTESEVRDELVSQGMSSDALEKLLPHKIFSGNHASNSILFKKLDPKTLGSLLAMYEHKVFVQSVIWNVNPFDQWGVELGKKLAGTILSELEGDSPVTGHDSSSNGLINHFKKNC